MLVAKVHAIHAQTNMTTILLQCHGDAVKHARTASCIPFIVFCSQPRMLLVWVRGPSSGNRPKCYQSSASLVVLSVGFHKHDHTGLGIAIGKVAFWLPCTKYLRWRLPILSTMPSWMLSWFLMSVFLMWEMLSWMLSWFLMSVFLMWEILNTPRIFQRHPISKARRLFFSLSVSVQVSSCKSKFLSPWSCIQARHTYANHQCNASNKTCLELHRSTVSVHWLRLMQSMHRAHKPTSEHRTYQNHQRYAGNTRSNDDQQNFVTRRECGNFTNLCQSTNAFLLIKLETKNEQMIKHGDFKSSKLNLEVSQVIL